MIKKEYICIMNLRLTHLFILLSFCFIGRGQISFLEIDSTYNRKRTFGVNIGIGTVWSGSIGGLASIWYKDAWGNGFKLFNDSPEWLQMDKAGHTYTGYHLTRNINNLYLWAGNNHNKSLIIGSAVATGYLATFEILDGFSSDWGFSWPDIAANTGGVAWYLAQELIWKEQRLKLKFSASPSPYAQYRPNTLGSTFSERLLKDYNGQTYWLTIAPRQFIKSWKWLPEWFSFSFGYSVKEKLHGFDNIYTISDPNLGQQTFYAKRQFLFSLDIDLEAIPVKKPWIKTLFSVLNHIKIPFPTIEYSDGSFKGHPVYF